MVIHAEWMKKRAEKKRPVGRLMRQSGSSEMMINSLSRLAATAGGLGNPPLQDMWFVEVRENLDTI